MCQTQSIPPVYSVLWIVLLSISLSGCKKNVTELQIDNQISYHSFEDFTDFMSTIELVSLSDNHSQIDEFWDSLISNQQIPYIHTDSVAFLYRNSSHTTVNWAGDFNGWNPVWEGKQLGNSDIYYYKTAFPSDARLDYKIVVGNSWKLDPVNPYQQYGGFGPNSELRMPEWVYPEETIANPNVISGSLSDNQITPSFHLGYNVSYKVYTPYNYESEDNLPVIYVTDGHEYIDDRFGSMITILDNLIYMNEINPIIAVFIDPRDPENLSDNRRSEQYTGNIDFANFVADELVKEIEANYKTDNSAEKRAILGTSLGGWNSAFFALKRSDVFQLIAIHSPAFDSNIITDHENSEELPIKVFMSTGVIYDTEDQARAMKVVFENKGYPLNYIEVNQGHSWGNWRGLIKAPLITFFGK